MTILLSWGEGSSAGDFEEDEADMEDMAALDYLFPEAQLLPLLPFLIVCLPLM